MKRRGEGNICGLLNETPPCCEPSGLRNHCAALFANEHGHSHRITFKCSKSLELFHAVPPLIWCAKKQDDIFQNAILKKTSY